MNNLTLLRESQFGSIVCDYYGDSKGEFYMTRSQIGKALEYSNPQKAIDNLHKAHKNRLDKCSVTLKLRSTDGKIFIQLKEFMRFADTAINQKQIYSLTMYMIF